MPVQQLIDDLLKSNLILAAVAAVSIFILLIVQIFATLVAIRVLLFIWRALGFLETGVLELSTKQRGLWGANSHKSLDDFHQSQSIRWRAAVAGMYVLWIYSPIVAAFYALGQPVAPFLLLVELILLILIAVVILFN